MITLKETKKRNQYQEFTQCFKTTSISIVQIYKPIYKVHFFKRMLEEKQELQQEDKSKENQQKNVKEYCFDGPLPDAVILKATCTSHLHLQLLSITKQELQDHVQLYGDLFADLSKELDKYTLDNQKRNIFLVTTALQSASYTTEIIYRLRMLGYKRVIERIDCLVNSYELYKN
jgi:hypothetical protein